MSDLHDRAARALGWNVNDVRSVSMQSLRDLVRPVDPNLAQEISLAIQSGAYIRGEPARARRSHSAKRKTLRADQLRKGDVILHLGGHVTVVNAHDHEGPFVIVRYDRADGTRGEFREHPSTSIEMIELHARPKRALRPR